ncbi:hypothetical protein VTI74DRAFT_6064 [Chaetomium olivicolor]
MVQLLLHSVYTGGVLQCSLDAVAFQTWSSSCRLQCRADGGRGHVSSITHRGASSEVLSHESLCDVKRGVNINLELTLLNRQFSRISNLSLHFFHLLEAHQVIRTRLLPHLLVQASILILTFFPHTRFPASAPKCTPQWSAKPRPRCRHCCCRPVSASKHPTISRCAETATTGWDKYALIVQLRPLRQHPDSTLP